MTKKEIGIYIDRTYKVVRQDLINRFSSAGIDITPEQWVLLSKLEGKERNQTDLASDSFRDKPTVSRIINLLLKKDYILKKQDPSDGRSFLISLTEKGRNKIKAARPHVYASREKGWQNLNEAEYNQLKFLLDKVFLNYMK